MLGLRVHQRLNLGYRQTARGGDALRLAGEAG